MRNVSSLHPMPPSSSGHCSFSKRCKTKWDKPSRQKKLESKVEGQFYFCFIPFDDSVCPNAVQCSDIRRTKIQYLDDVSRLGASYFWAWKAKLYGPNALLQLGPRFTFYGFFGQKFHISYLKKKLKLEYCPKKMK